MEFHYGSTTGVGHTSDISHGGLFLSCNTVADEGARIYLRLYLPNQRTDPLKIIGLVKRAVADGEEPGMGIHFEVAYAKTRDALGEFIDKLLVYDDNDRGAAARDSEDSDVDRDSADRDSDPDYHQQAESLAEVRRSMTAEELDQAIEFDADYSRLKTVAKTALWLVAMAIVLLVGYGIYVRAGGR